MQNPDWSYKKKAKILHFDEQIINSNKIKKAWDIIHLETQRKINNGEIHSLKIEDKSITNQQSIAEAFNTYFLTIAYNIKSNKKSGLYKN